MNENHSYLYATWATRASATAGCFTLPFVKALADRGPEAAMAADPHLASGLNIQQGQVKHPAVAESLVAQVA